MYNVTAEYLTGLADKLANVITAPTFLSHIEKIQKSSGPDEQYALAEKITPDRLRQEGIETPEGFRVVPRTFEEPEYSLQNGAQLPGKEPGSDRDRFINESYDRSSFPDEPIPGQPEEMAAPETIAKHLKDGLYNIAEFVSEVPFRNLLNELAEVSPEDRPDFILDVVMNNRELAKRDITVPDNMTIQRSTFHDGRPTLFCVSAITALGYPWRKVTFTFDNEILEDNKAA